MNDYCWLLTVKVGDTLCVASIRDGSPAPGDLVELEGGALATVVTRSLYSELDDAEYQKSVAVATPRKVVAYYSRHAVEEGSNETA